LLHKRVDSLLAGVCGGIHLATARLKLNLGRVELLRGGCCAVDLVQDGLSRLGSQVGDLHLLVAVVLEVAALHADGLVAGDTMELQWFIVNLAARDDSGCDRRWRSGCGRREVHVYVYDRVRLVLGLLVRRPNAIVTKVLGFLALSAVPG
jgi:hypothetical protein